VRLDIVARQNFYINLVRGPLDRLRDMPSEAVALPPRLALGEVSSPKHAPRSPRATPPDSNTKKGSTRRSHL